MISSTFRLIKMIFSGIFSIFRRTMMSLKTEENYTKENIHALVGHETLRRLKFVERKEYDRYFIERKPQMKL
jgi:hypothetical protein